MLKCYTGRKWRNIAHSDICCIMEMTGWKYAVFYMYSFSILIHFSLQSPLTGNFCLEEQLLFAWDPDLSNLCSHELLFKKLWSSVEDRECPSELLLGVDPIALFWQVGLTQLAPLLALHLTTATFSTQLLTWVSAVTARSRFQFSLWILDCEYNSEVTCRHFLPCYLWQSAVACYSVNTTELTATSVVLSFPKRRAV